MKKLIFILNFLISTILSGQTYYVTPRGNDSNDGSDTTAAHAFLTIPKGLSVLNGGDDSLVIRQGTYAISSYLNITTYSGTSGHNIVVMGYPGDDRPVIDADGCYQTSALWIHDVDYWKFYRIVIVNAEQDGNTAEVGGFHASRCGGITFEYCATSNIWGYGFKLEQGTRAVGGVYRLINCDANNNVDWDTPLPGNGSGCLAVIGHYTNPDTTAWMRVYVDGCRSWNNGDSGFGMAYGATVHFNRCWAFGNGGRASGGVGKGFSMGLHPPGPPYNRVNKVLNCLSLWNSQTGFRTNNNQSTYQSNIYYYNNIGAYNGENNFIGQFKDPQAGGYSVYKNNIAYGQATNIGWYVGYNFAPEPLWVYTSEYNSWDVAMGITLTDADWLDVFSDSTDCVTFLASDRAADGSLPDVGDYFHIDTGSDLIGSGIGVGLTYDGENNYHNDPPDLGPFAYDATPPEPPEYPQVTTIAVSAYNSFRATTGGSGIVTAQGTIVAKGVCWSTSINPTIANSKTNDGTGTDTYASEITGLSSGTTYHIRAYVTDGAAQTSYGADVPLTTPSVNYFLDGVKLLYDPATNKFIKR